MARPTSRVNEENLYVLLAYLKGMFDDYTRTYRLGLNFEEGLEAQRSIDDIWKKYLNEKADNKTALFVPILQNWIDGNLNQESWHRALIAIRQKKFNDKHRNKKARISFRVPFEDQYNIEKYAKLVNLSIGEAIALLVKKEVHRLENEEYKKGQNTDKKKTS